MEFLFFIFMLFVGIAFLAVGVFVSLKVLQLLFPNLLSGGGASKMVQWVTSSVVPRFILVGLLTVLMTIPLGGLKEVVEERAGRHNEALRDIAQTWGGRQVVSGPMLVIPFTVRYRHVNTFTDKHGESKEVVKDTYKDKHFVILPESLDMQFSLQDEVRKYSIYSSLVYRSDIGMTGKFEIPSLRDRSKHIHQIHFDQSYLAMSLSDIKAINTIDNLQWGSDASIRFDSGIKLPISPIGSANISLSGASNSSKAAYTVAEASSSASKSSSASGFHAVVGKVIVGQHYDFAIKLNVNGSYGLRFAPFGRQTTVAMDSTWPHPSFRGAVLPQSHNITADAFTAQWDVPSIARNYPQSFILEDQTVYLDELLAGVDLVEPVNLYSKVIRAVKYGLLFIGLTFLTFLIFEMGTGKSGRRLHIIQYALIGGALGLFYLVLLSLSEHIDFFKSYVLAVATIIGIIVMYTLAVSRSMMRSIIVGIMLIALYAVLYALLNLEDYALLMGSGLLLVVMIVLMFITRNMNRPSLPQ